MAYWTADRDRRLLELISQGLSYSAIGVAMGTTKGSVIGRSFRIKEGAYKAELKAAVAPVAKIIIKKQFGRVKFMESQAWHCRYPYWKAGETDFDQMYYCGNAVKIGSLCGDCHALSYRKTDPIRI